ncbi:hypothetical protein ACFLR7_03735, partial [Acidobacteriota bacterium]
MMGNIGQTGKQFLNKGGEMKKPRGIFFLALLVLLLSADFVMVQEEHQKETPVPKIVYAEVEQPDPVVQALVDQLKHYRTIGDVEKANEIWKELTPLINSEPEKLEIEEKVNSGAVVGWTAEDEETGRFSTHWLGTDYYVMANTNHNKAPSMEVLSGQGTYNPNMYVAGEEWWEFNNPNQIMVRRSDTHGTSWPVGSPYSQMITSVFELSAPKIKQIHPDYLAVVFQRQYTPSDYDIHWAKIKWDFSSSEYLIIDDSSGTSHRYPDITSDFEDFGADAYIYVVYWQGNSLFFTRSIDGGDTWSSPVLITTQGLINQCSIDYEDGNLYIAFHHYHYSVFVTYSYISVTKSTDLGISWSSETNVGGTWGSYPSIAANGDTVIAAYEYPGSSTGQDILFSFSANGGLSWNTNNDLDTSPVDETRPILRSYKGVDPNIYCAYKQEPSFVTIWRATATEPWNWSYVGSVKDTPTDVSMDTIPGLVPKLTPSGSIEGVAVCWEEYYDPINGYDIAFDGYWLPCVPGVFSYVEPTNIAADVALNTDLDWDDSVVADSYDVYFGTSSPPPFVTNVSSSSYDPGYLDYDTTYYWKVVAKNVCGETSGPEWSFSTAVPTASQKSDFNGDGQDDILWRNYADGRNAVWFMGDSGGGAAELNLKGLGMMDIGQGMRQDRVYQDPMREKGRFNRNAVKEYWSPIEGAGLVYQREEYTFDWKEWGDAKEIQVLAGPVNGEGAELSIQALVRTGSAYLSSVVDTNWDIVGTGDFNGDGKVDILWRNYADGKDAVWYMDGVSRTGSAYLSTVTDTN